MYRKVESRICEEIEFSADAGDGIVNSKDREAAAYDVLELASREKLSLEEWRSISHWLRRLASTQARPHDRSRLVLERAALQYLLQAKSAAAWLDAESREILARRLSENDFNITGKPAMANAPVPSIPFDALSSVREDVGLLYEAVRFAREREQLIFRDIPRAAALASFATRLRASSLMNGKFILFAALSCLACMSALGRELVLGALVGMIGASFNEYLIHLGIGHASVEGSIRFRRWGLVGRFAEEINLAHRIHHAKMSTDFRVEFTHPKTRARIDRILESQAEKIVSDRIATGVTSEALRAVESARIVSEIKAGGYGVNGTPAGVVAMLITAAPFFTLNWLIHLVFGGPVFLLTAAIFLVGFITQSLFSHQYLHMTDEDLRQDPGVNKTTAFMRWFMRTPVGKLQRRRHYRHHHEAFHYGGTANGVIMSFSFVDYFLRGGVLEANVKHLLKMRREGF